MGRLSCCVPFCTHTSRNDAGHAEWICAKHWRLVPPKVRRFKFRTESAYVAAKIRCEAAGLEEPVLSIATARLNRKREQASRAWDRCKRAAFEAAGGIS